MMAAFTNTKAAGSSSGGFVFSAIHDSFLLIRIQESNMADQKPLTAADVAASLKDHKVRMHAMKDGAPVRDKEGNYKVIERAPRAEDVISFAVSDDGVITAVTCDGQKLTA